MAPGDTDFQLSSSVPIPELAFRGLFELILDTDSLEKSAIKGIGLRITISCDPLATFLMQFLACVPVGSLNSCSLKALADIGFFQQAAK